MLSYRFGDHLLDVDRRELRRGAESVPVEPQVFDLLVHLLRHRDRVVTKDELLGAVWRGRVVSESTLSSRINAARVAIGDSGDRQHLVKTVARKGFRFIGEVREMKAPTSTASSDTGPGPGRVLHDVAAELPVVAVRRFANVGGEASEAYFADGMTQEIVRALSRIRWVNVVAAPGDARDALAAPETVAAIGRDTGARYVLEGSVRKAGGRVRISARLVETGAGAHLWADHFDAALEDVFDVQDAVALSVAGVIEPTLEAAEVRRSTRARTEDLTAYDLYLRALSDHLSFRKERVLRALDLLEQAIVRDPEFGAALSVAAWCHVQIETYGWSDDAEQNRRDGLALAHRAIQVADDDPAVIARAAFAVSRFGDDIDGAIDLIDRSLQLNPGFAGGWHVSGWLRLFAGQPDMAIEHFAKSIRLSPRGQRMETQTGIGACHLLAGRFEEAAAVLRKSLEQHPHFAQTYRYLAAALAHAGHITEAREIVERLKAITPIVAPPVLPFRDAGQRELVFSGLRLALAATGVDG